MTEETSFRVLMRQLVDGREEAAAEIVEDYTAALVAVARRGLSPKLARRVDPEDVVQSAYRSFFVRMGRGEYDLGNGSELWKLLLTITLNKLRRQGRFHHARKRDVASDQSGEVSGRDLPLENASTGQPGPQDAAMLVDEVTALLRTLRPDDRTVVELRLQGYNSIEIAKETGRAERSVRRVLEKVRAGLFRGLEGG